MGGKAYTPQMGRLQEGGDFLIARQVLAAQRKAGADFDEAWQWALKMVGRDDRTVLELTRGQWECAYHRRPFWTSESMSLLADEVDGDGDRRYDTQLIA